MSDIVGELERVSTAFEQPTLRLLHQTHAAVVLAIFRSSFNRERPTVPAAVLHEQVESYLDELRAAGRTAVPQGTGRQLCQRWTAGQWLSHDSADDGTAVYALTSHAQEALEVTQNMMRDRAALSEHRISTIMAAMRRFNAQANPDRSARIEILETEIARLVRDRDRLVAGGTLEPVSQDFLIEGYAELLSLVNGLPSDFTRVEESFRKLRDSILKSFREEARPAGEIVDEYLDQADELMRSSAEGRAFDGAVALLSDDALLLQLREDITALLDHPAADALLSAADRHELHSTVAVIRTGMRTVLERRKRVTAALSEYIRTHDAARDRELDRLLKSLDGELTDWMAYARARAAVPVELAAERVDLEHLRERFSDTSVETPPAPLGRPEADRPAAASLSELLAAGGPSVEQLRVRMAAAITGDDFATVGALFNEFPPELRRPVEVAGLMQLVANATDLAPDGGRETFEAVRPDGTGRTLSAPRATRATSTTNHED